MQLKKKLTTEHEARKPAEQRRTGAKRKRPPIFVYMMYILVATVVCTGVTFSSYISTVSGGDEARVAKFDVTETGLNSFESVAVTVKRPGTEQEFDLNITNNSEVSVRYTVTIMNQSDNLPLHFLVQQNDGGTMDWDKTNAAQTLYTFEEVLAPGAVKAYKLLVYWPDTDPEFTKTSYAGKTDTLKVQITANQED